METAKDGGSGREPSTSDEEKTVSSMTAAPMPPSVTSTGERFSQSMMISLTVVAPTSVVQPPMELLLSPELQAANHEGFVTPLHKGRSEWAPRVQ